MFDKPLWIGERYLGELLLPDERFVRGRFVNVDLQSRTATFIPTAAADIGSLLAGMTYSRFDGYRAERAALVLDRQRCWTQRIFEPVDAVTFKRSDDTIIEKIANPNLSEGGTVIKGGWDHEHCDICWGTISPQTDPVAMFSDPDHWICQKCYENFVLPRSLGFIVEDFGD